jgi:copper transport protein
VSTWRYGSGRRPLVARLASLAVTLLIAGAVWFAAAPAAAAHALPVSSTPAAGSSLTQLPSSVTVVFSEGIVARLSSLEVVDASGHVVSRGPSQPVPGSSLGLTVALPTLLGGVYTVRWKTVSSDDGHTVSGTFTFGIGPLAYAAMSGPAPQLLSAPSSATPAGVAGRWLFDSGLGLMVGGCWIAAFGFPGAGRRPLILALGGTGVLLIGLVVTGWAQTAADQIGIGELASTSLGLGLIVQAVPGLLAGGCAAAALRWPQRTPRRVLLRSSLVLAGITTVAHVLTTHAASGANTGLALFEQWVHVAAYATWIGGLAALLLTIGTRPSPAKSAAIRRFSRVAGYSLLALCVSGALRAWDELGTEHALEDTFFGKLVLLKVALVVGLAGFGGYNRYRSVPAADHSLTRLRRVGTIELGLAAFALIAAATLSSTLPPALIQGAAAQKPAPQELVYGTAPGVRASLTVSPGYAGPNRFVLRVYDTSTGRELTGQQISGGELSFTPYGSAAKAAVLPLNLADDGDLSAIGQQLTLTGRWSVTARLKLPGGGAASTGGGSGTNTGTDTAAATAIPFTLACSPSPSELEEMTMGRMAMVYGLQLSGGRQLEAYLTPGRSGKNTVHLVFTNSHDAEISLLAPPTVTVHENGSSISTLPMRPAGTSALLRSDYYAASTYTSGQWDFHVSAREPDGNAMTADFTLSVN